MSRNGRFWLSYWRAYGRPLLKTPRAALRDRTGVTLVIYALVLPVLLGFTGLAVEVGTWYTQRNELQSAADAGALAGAWVLKAGGTGAEVVAAVDEAIGKNSISPDTVTVNTPPQSGPYAGNAKAVQVLLGKHESPLFSAVFSLAAFDVETQAVALVYPTEPACVLALNSSSASTTVSVSGNADIQFANCVMAANSSNPTQAIAISGDTQLSAESIAAVGAIYTSGEVTVNLTQPAQTGITPILDPFANLSITSPNTCDYATTQTYTSTADLHPGTYCGGITINNRVSATLEPGTYYIDGGNLQINGQATVQCDCTAPGSGVTFVFTNQGGDGSTGTVTINGTATVNLTAPTNTSDPTDYPYPGMLFVQDRNASAGEVATLNGNASSSLQGAFYFPNSQVAMSGNYSNTANCTELVAWEVQLKGTPSSQSTFDTNSACAAAQINPLVVTAVQLVE